MYPASQYKLHSYWDVVCLFLVFNVRKARLGVNPYNTQLPRYSFIFLLLSLNWFSSPAMNQQNVKEDTRLLQM